MSIRSDVLNDTTLETTKIITLRVHEVHARHEYPVKTSLCPSVGSSLILVLSGVHAAQETLERELGGSLLPIKTLR